MLSGNPEPFLQGTGFRLTTCLNDNFKDIFGQGVKKALKENKLSHA
jgi:hypothetical protein